MACPKQKSMWKQELAEEVSKKQITKGSWDRNEQKWTGKARISFYKDDTGCNEQDELEEGKTQGQEISEEVAAVIQERDVEG